jgi:hypothetical protein
MRVLMNISGTMRVSALSSRVVSGGSVMDVLLISVRTDDTRLIKRALTLALSCWPPKPGSAADAVQPTSFTRQSGFVAGLPCALV